MQIDADGLVAVLLTAFMANLRNNRGWRGTGVFIKFYIVSVKTIDSKGHATRQSQRHGGMADGGTADSLKKPKTKEWWARRDSNTRPSA
jgi:hypothetical protein